MSQFFNAPPPSTPAGWYPNPSGDGRLRYWNGTGWTEDFHTPDAPAFGGPMPSALDVTRSAPRSATDARGWRLRHSAWLLAPILGFGYLSCVGFIYCAIRVGPTRWRIVAAVSAGLTILAWVLVATSLDSTQTPAPDATFFVVQLWVASIVFAILLNRDYLAFRASSANPRPGP